MRQYATHMHGEWYSAPDSPYQNACIAAEIDADDLPELREELVELRKFHGQNSVALALADTDFL
jgi:hypothetical protein